MIITSRKPVEEICESIKSCERVFLVGCGECATICKTGGDPEIARMRAALQERDVIVTGACIPKAPCVLSQTKSELVRNMTAAREAQAVIVLACGLGVQAVREALRRDVPVFPGCDTLCGAVVDSKGNFSQKCSLCGECLLAQTAAICPTTLCAKGLLNGPCGGMKKGKCEVDSERDCAWVSIYQSLAKQNNLDSFATIKKPKNHMKAASPQYVVCCQEVQEEDGTAAL